MSLTVQQRPSKNYRDFQANNTAILIINKYKIINRRNKKIAIVTIMVTIKKLVSLIPAVWCKQTDTQVNDNTPSCEPISRPENIKVTCKSAVQFKTLQNTCPTVVAYTKGWSTTSHMQQAVVNDRVDGVVVDRVNKSIWTWNYRYFINSNNTIQWNQFFSYDTNAKFSIECRIEHMPPPPPPNASVKGSGRNYYTVSWPPELSHPNENAMANLL